LQCLQPLDFYDHPQRSPSNAYAGNKGLTWPAVDGSQDLGSSGCDGQAAYPEVFQSNL